MATRQQAELHPAYVWDCEDCGAENFTRAVVHEFSACEAEELAEAGVRADTGNWVTIPESVKCHACGCQFEARHFRQDDELPQQGL